MVKCKKSEVPSGGAKTVEAGGRMISIFNVGGSFHALDDSCPHMGGPLGEGALEGSIVTCPWHGWKLDVKTGAHCVNAAIKAKTYPVKAEGDDLLVEV